MHLVFAQGSGFPAEVLRQTRDWAEAEWAAGVDRLVRRGLIAVDGTATDEGRALHAHIETTTDDLALRAPVTGLGDVEAASGLADDLTALARAVSRSGVLPGRAALDVPET